MSKFLASRSAKLGLCLCLCFALAALLADLLSPYPIGKLDLAHRLAPPDNLHILGTDNLGRDLFSRLLHGARISLMVGTISVGLSLTIGVALGAIAGFLGGRVESAIMACMDLLLAFPSILLAIAIVAILGNSLTNAMLAVGIVGIPVFARLTRASVLAVKELEFVQAAIAIGASPSRVLFVHILPNCLNPIVVQATLSIGTAVLEAAGLSFLGLGAKPPTPEWGTMLADSYRYYDKAPWLVVAPGFAILTMVLGFNLLGDGLRDALDPKTRH